GIWYRRINRFSRLIVHDVIVAPVGQIRWHSLTPDFRALPQWSAYSLFQLPERRLVIGAGLVVQTDRLVVAALGVEQFQKAGRPLLVAGRGYGFQSALPFDRG